MANRISLVSQPLVHYRVNQSSNTQSKTYTCPYDFSLTITAVKDKLVELGVFEDVEKSFIHYALDTTLYAEKKLRGYECHSEIHNALVNHLFQEYGISTHPPAYYYNKYKYFEYLVVSASTPEFLEKKNLVCQMKSAVRHPLVFSKACLHLLYCSIRLSRRCGIKLSVTNILKNFI